MDLQLKGKLALVSGSTAGIGYAIARNAQARRQHLVGLDRRAQVIGVEQAQYVLQHAALGQLVTGRYGNRSLQFLGPTAFMRPIKRHLSARGVPDSPARHEFFGPAEALY